MKPPETHATIEVSYMVWIIGAIFLGLAAVITWLDARAKRLLNDATASFQADIDSLKRRVSALEEGQTAARGHIDDAIVMAAKAGQEDIVKCLRQAQTALH